MGRYSVLKWTLTTVALAEFLVMEIIDLIGISEGIWEYAFDSALLAALSAPLLYLRLMRGLPVRDENKEPDVSKLAITPLKELERQALINALGAAHGDCRRAAQLLGIGRATVYRKLRKYDIHAAARSPHHA